MDSMVHTQLRSSLFSHQRQIFPHYFSTPYFVSLDDCKSGCLSVNLKSASHLSIEHLKKKSVLHRKRNILPRVVDTSYVRAASGNTPDAEMLKEQLALLQTEAFQVRDRNNSARARFMRLTDVAEQLRQRAAVDVKLGNEEAAEKLLREKQKVMKAVELSKRRAEFLEEFSAKLGEAITQKETELIASLSCSRLDMRAPKHSGAAEGHNVHVIAPKESLIVDKPKRDDVPKKSGTHGLQEAISCRHEGKVTDSDDAKDHDLQQETGVNVSSTLLNKETDEEKLENTRELLDQEIIAIFNDYLQGIDHQVASVESNLQGFVNSAQIILRNKDKDFATDEMVATVQQLLKDAQVMRARISGTIS